LNRWNAHNNAWNGHFEKKQYNLPIFQRSLL
jgi:hypothetical protein